MTETVMDQPHRDAIKKIILQGSNRELFWFAWWFIRGSPRADMIFDGVILGIPFKSLYRIATHKNKRKKVNN